MLRMFHRFQKHVAGFVIIGGIMLMMGGFGLRLMDKGHKVNAITVGDEEISYQDFHRQVSATESRYRKAFGASYDDVIRQLNLNVGQQVTDQLIGAAVSRQMAKRLGFVVGANEWREGLSSRAFPNGYSLQAYQEFLEANRLSQSEFEELLRGEILRAQFLGVVQDVSHASLAEARAANIRKETAYSIKYLEADPATFAKKVGAIDEAKLRAWYDSHQEEVSLPPRVSYEYIEVSPKDFEKSVQVTDDDVELEYTDNSQKYSKPETVHARQILLTFPAEADAAKKDEIRKKAQDLIEELKNGTPFEALAKASSDDTATKDKGGDLGWIGRGFLTPEFDRGVFGRKDISTPFAVNTPYGVHVVKIEEQKANELKPLTEVRPQIEAEIRKREAPTYAADKAHEWYDEWTKRKLSLSDFAKEKGLILKSTPGMLSAEKDPEGQLKGLTSQVVENADDQLLVELADSTVLVGVKGRKDVEPAPFAEMKAKAEEAIRAQLAKDAARGAADAALAKLVKGEAKDLAAVASSDLQLKDQADIKLSGFSQGIAGSKKVQDGLIATSKAPKTLDSVINEDGKFYVVQVVGITPGGEPKDPTVLTNIQTEESQKSGTTWAEALIQSEKLKLKIDVREGLLAAS